MRCGEHSRPQKAAFRAARRLFAVDDGAHEVEGSATTTRVSIGRHPVPPRRFHLQYFPMKTKVKVNFRARSLGSCGDFGQRI